MNLLISLLFALIGFLFSWTGVFTFLVGVLLFITLPVASLLTGFKKLARFHIYLAMWAVKRAAIVVSEHDDLLFKSMSFDDLGVEQITFGSETKEFEDPATALHHFMGFPFALADEVHGVLFDPRHAAIGDREHQAEEQNEMYIRATGDEWDAYEVYGWVKGVFELPKSKHELVDLSKVRQIVTGTERAEYPSRIETMYRNSRKPYASRASVIRMAMPVLSFLAVFGGLWFMATQGSGGGGGGSTIGYGSGFLLVTAGLTDLKDRIRDVEPKDAAVMLTVMILTAAAFVAAYLTAGLLLAVCVSAIVLGALSRAALIPHWMADGEDSESGESAAIDSEAITAALRDGGRTVAAWMRSASQTTQDVAGTIYEEVDWPHVGKILALVLPLPVAFLLVAMLAGVVTAVLAFIVLGMGFWFLPLLTVLARPSKKLSGVLASLYLMLGFLGYDKPVFEWTPEKYRLREFDDLDDTTNVKWYGLANSLVGFTFKPGEDSWGPEVVSHTELDSRSELVADGGTKTNIPAGYTRYPDMQRAVYAGYVPTRIKRHYYYLHSGITLSRFTDAAIGEKSLRKLLESKEKHGEGSWGLSDRTLLFMTMGAAIIAAVLGVFVFFL